jgi:hypothetical protein
MDGVGIGVVLCDIGMSPGAGVPLVVVVEAMLAGRVVSGFGKPCWGGRPTRGG